MKTGLLSGMLCCLLGSALGAVEIYVSPQGNDSATGSKKHPVATLQGAMGKVRALGGGEPVSVKVASGRYFMQQPLVLTEKDAREIRFEGAAGEKPVISGGMVIKGWEEMPNGWWKTFVPEVAYQGLYFEQLYVGGNRATRARTPNKGWFPVKSVTESDQYDTRGRYARYARQKIEVQPQDLASVKNLNAKDREDVVITFYHKWDMTRKHPDYLNGDAGVIITSGEGMKPWNALGAGTRYTLENYKEALDEPGEWFLARSGELYYIPRPGEKKEEVEFIAPVLGQLLVCEGKTEKPLANKSFKNLSFRHAAYKMPRFGNDPMQAAAAVDSAIRLKFAEKVELTDCEIMHTGNYAISFGEGVRYSSLTGSRLFDLGAGGVRIGEPTLPTSAKAKAHHIVVDNNIIQNAGWIFPPAAGVVIFHASDNRIIHNEISDMRYTGVSVGWVWGYGDSKETISTGQVDANGDPAEVKGEMSSLAINNEIAWNHIHHIGWGLLSDMGAVYTLGESPGTRVHSNVIHDVYSYDYGGWGLYTDEGSSHIIMENNLVYGCKSGAFHQHYGRENIIRNNIFAFSQYFQIQFTRPENHQSFSFTRNIVLMDSGVLLKGAWGKALLESDKNCFWDLRNQSLDFAGQTWEQWQQKHDQNSEVKDPGFRNPVKFDFTFADDSVAKSLGFIPFDYSKAGVYGNESWKKKAQLSPEKHEEFKKIIREREKEYSRIYQ